MVRVFKNHIIKFKKAKDFDYFNRDGINNFIIYLRDTGGLQENSVKKQYKNLLWFMNWAIRKGYTKETTVQTYKPKFKLVEKPVIFLTREELLTVYNYKVPKNGTKVKLKDLGGNEYEKEVEEAREKIFRIIKASPTLSKMEIADLCGLKKEGVRYHIEILRKEVGLHWTGNSLNGRWKWEE